ncbi:hypothetical protein [Gracilibacillus alcaliphilus]|uniref:hypothetical protein n=1 Tax=Gracilibacillus alcaliphilus TaxID=1401441 RepID=UPI001956BF3C|nr:hypothetical protein [Gracilibacillus alcaliphilus]MBM7675034.1 hypothetical protein [Gracilibacillus alcaliphilus]
MRKKWNNNGGYIFPTTSIIILLLLFITFHQINQYQIERELQQLNKEQYKLEMLYHKGYQLTIINPPVTSDHYLFPDGTITITQMSSISTYPTYQLELETDTGASRLSYVYLIE